MSMLSVENEALKRELLRSVPVSSSTTATNSTKQRKHKRGNKKCNAVDGTGRECTPEALIADLMLQRHRRRQATPNDFLSGDEKNEYHDLILELRDIIIRSKARKPQA